MPVKMRLQRKGRRKKPFYQIVIADARSPRDGKYIERIGSYNPMTKPATIDIDRDVAFEWLNKGAQPTDTVRAILRFKGVMFRKHLMRGVKKGAFSEEVAMQKYHEWIEAKEAKIASRIEETASEMEALRKQIFGKIPTIELAPDPDELTKIEGVGPKIAEAMNAAGLLTFAQVAEAGADKIKEILDAAEGNFAAHDPGTWSQQAQMAADGKWDELKVWQDELDGGKEVVAEEAPAAEETPTEEAPAKDASEENAE